MSDSVAPGTTAHQAPLFFTISQNSHRETVTVNLYTYKYKNGVHILFLTDVLKENKQCQCLFLICINVFLFNSEHGGS